MSIYNRFDSEVIYKEDNSPLTEADLAANRILTEGLKNFSPNLPVVSEEDKNSLTIPKRNKSFWLIDPLDGTKEFIKKNGQFTTNLALIENNKPTLGFVGVPALNQVFEGGLGFGSRRHSQNGKYQVIKCLKQSSKIPLRVVASKSHLNEETLNFINNLDKNAKLIQAGSSLKFIKVAEGEADLYPRLAPTSEWDTAAAHAIVEGAGGSVTQINGQPLTYGKENILNPFFIVKGLI